MGMNDDIFLLAIQGILKPKTLEDSRITHNMTAGNPDGVAAARALGDLSHNVFVTAGDSKGPGGELLILDLWNNLDGFNQFFANKQVQEGGAMIFASVESRELWSPAQEFRSFILPTPAARNDFCVGLLRGTVRSREFAKAAFDKMAKDTINAARMEGQVSREIFFRMSAPGQPATLDLLGVDVWMDGEGMGRFYSNPQHMSPIRDIFAGPPATSTWKHPAGQWIEW
ncbi:MAG TPA: hypothetical protein VH278_07840 [Burkholderiaceae bacterium]|jgi:hypothetical protein|nr:hypothetical protein [Burkholderiaceae bacterium]